MPTLSREIEEKIIQLHLQVVPFDVVVQAKGPEVRRISWQINIRIETFEFHNALQLVRENKIRPLRVPAIRIERRKRNIVIRLKPGSEILSPNIKGSQVKLRIDRTGKSGTGEDAVDCGKDVVARATERFVRQRSFGRPFDEQKRAPRARPAEQDGDNQRDLQKEKADERKKRIEIKKEAKRK